MIQKMLVGVILLVSIIRATRGQGSTTTRKIFQPPGNSTIDQIAGTSTPWVLPELIPIIKEFKKNVFEDLQASPQVRNIWGTKIKGSEIRTVFFKLVNKFLDAIGHPAPAALANIVSKEMSRFDPLTVPVLFEIDSIYLAEFFLSKGIKIERETATRYAGHISKALESADPNNPESVWQALSEGYGNFIASYNLNPIDIVDELLELLTSEFIVVHDK